MKKQFTASEWIWKQGPVVYDDYAEFCGDFSANPGREVHLNISADSNCNVYINGELVFFKQYTDYPHYKMYDHVDITQFCGGKNELLIRVWYYGKDNASYYCSAPGLLFEIRQDGQLLLGSDENIQSRTDSRYRISCGKEITSQLGFSFFFDNTIKNELPWTKSVIAEKNKELHLNVLRKLELQKRTDFQIVRKNKNCALIDLGYEQTGFLELKINSSIDQEVTIAYGEHIADGNVRRCIGTRDFSAGVRLSAGENEYINTFRRIAGRYLEIFYEYPLQIEYLGLVPVTYPVNQKSFTAESDLQQKIYDTAVRTLQLSMHEHYEDCPWREQAMYVLDSRNQMLCGYYCFDNALYARENLVLMSRGIREDGLLELTYPAKGTPAIPFFSLMYPVAVSEYVSHTGDVTILPEVMPVVESILNAFRKFTEAGSLIPNFPYPYWNFYEWSEGSDHSDEINRNPDTPYYEQFDLILNCGYLLAEEKFARMTGIKRDLSKLKGLIYQAFYSESDGMFFAGTNQKNLFTELGNSLAVLTGVAGGCVRSTIANKLMNANSMVKVTLSMLCFKYDALLMEDTDCRDYVIQDIEAVYGHMLDSGATSFWETEKGESDFEGAGSLCHGWSAIPIYYFHLFRERK